MKMRRAGWRNILPALLALATGCAAPATIMRVSPAPLAVAPRTAPDAVSTISALNPALPPPAAAVVSAEIAKLAEASADDQSDDDADEGTPSADEGEGESHIAPGDPTGPRYTTELSDAELEKLWRGSPERLGSISAGFVDSGRLINGLRFPEGDPAWTVVSPEKSYATRETIDYLVTAIHAVKAQYPDSPPLRVNQISGPEGGWLRPHKSHQNGRDADIAFYYPTAEVVRARERERYIDVTRSWAFIKAVVTLTDVQFVLVDKRVQKVLYDHALKAGEDKAWLDTLFHAGPDSVIKHARHHRDHFHVRFYNPRAQELGRRVAPLLAEKPEFNVAMHKVKHGDNLGKIALRYGSSVSAIRKANHMKNNFLKLGMVLQVPLHGACTHCPVPAQVVVPPRRLPASMLAQKQVPAPPALTPVAPASTPPVAPPTVVPVSAAGEVQPAPVPASAAVPVSAPK
jgi:murein endopeptidase